jgi:hypothetical protein
MKKIELITIITNEDWIITDLTFDEELEKYTVSASHKSGEVVKLVRTKKLVDKILKQIENEQKRD